MIALGISTNQKQKSHKKNGKLYFEHIPTATLKHCIIFNNLPEALREIITYLIKIIGMPAKYYIEDHESLRTAVSAAVPHLLIP